MHLADPKFPPAYSGHGVTAPLFPRDVALRGASAGDLGAADIVWARRVDRVELAIVLEPDVPPDRLGEVRVLLQTALIDCLGALMPSQTAIQIGWPDAILCNGAKVGETIVIGAPPDANGAVAWCVAGLRLTMTRDLRGLEPGLVRDETSLHEEDGGELDRTIVLQSLSAHFLNVVHGWESDGIRPFIERWIGRVLGYEAPADMRDTRTTGASLIRGRVSGVDDTLALMVTPDAASPSGSGLVRLPSPIGLHGAGGAANDGAAKDGGAAP